ncbi:MAG TPA: biotin/lipoyl-binding protein [Methanomicrobia archaeon]|nr:biotin/lipoyl-binding protein [Methanomicrobia archaeon]HEC95431.1 biotin/lipoyl-binding protein [Euryarchaeota archaeon]
MKKYRVFVDGIEYLVEVEESEFGVYSIKLGEKEAKIRIEEVLDIKRKERGDIERKDIKTERKIEKKPIIRGEGTTLTAPMPGKVIEVIAKRGSEVKLGDPVIILEAMKMKNEISAPVSGIVKEIRVKEGENVDSGDIIAVIG